jgi:hypothetical protein
MTAKSAKTSAVRAIARFKEIFIWTLRVWRKCSSISKLSDGLLGGTGVCI